MRHAQQRSVNTWKRYVRDLAQADPEGSRYTRKWPKCQVPTPAPLPSPPSLHLWPHRELPHIKLAEEEQTGPGLQTVLHDMQTPPPSGQLQHYTPSGTPLEDMVEGHPPSGQNFEQCTWLFPLLKGRNGRKCDYLPVFGLWSVVCLMVRYSEGT